MYDDCDKHFVGRANHKGVLKEKRQSMRALGDGLEIQEYKIQRVNEFMYLLVYLCMCLFVLLINN